MPGSGFIYDDSVHLSNNKSDGHTPPSSSRIVADEWNAHSNALNDTRNAIKGGDFHGARDMSAAMPDISPANESRWTSRGGQLSVSENGGPYVWIKAVEYLNVCDKRFAGGARGDGIWDDAPAINAAIAAAASTYSKRRVVYLPNPEDSFRCRSPLIVPGSLGFTMVGEGKWASRLLVDPSGVTDDAKRGLVINSCQHVTLEGFGIWGKATNKASYAIHFDYDPVVFASYGHQLRDIFINSDDDIALGQAFDYGIVFDDSYGNNSEIALWGVYIYHFTEAGVWLPGSQQKSVTFYGCQINGLWNGISGSGVGGKMGIRAGGGAGGAGGSFQFLGGGMSSCSEAGFSIESPNDPIILDGVQTENLYRFMGTSSNVAGSGRQAVIIRGCRLDVINDFDPDGYIKFYGMGPYVFEGNSIYAEVPVAPNPPPQIRLCSSVSAMSARITNNLFLTKDGADHQPIINGGTYDRGDIQIHSNIYSADGVSLTPAVRVEWLQHEFAMPEGTGLNRSQDFRSGQCMLTVAAAAFTANATTQSVKVFEFPRGTKIKSCHVYQYDGFNGVGLLTCTLSLGKTSGGATYLAPMNLMETQKFRGNSAAELGSDLSTAVQGGYVPDYFAVTDLWANVTTTGMNIGDGSATNFTVGYFFIILTLEVIQRHVTGA